MKKRTQTGFTLYELLTTMLVVGVILALGVPNFTAFRQNSRMTASANDLHSAFHLARSEASRTKASITICASADSMNANPTCGAAATFNDGWIVFQDDDINNPGDVPNIVVDANEPVLRQFPAVDPQLTITTNGTRDYFTFGPTGQGRQAAGETPVSTVMLCDDRGNVTAAGGRSAARVLVVTPLGRATVLRNKQQITDQGGCP